MHQAAVLALAANAAWLGFAEAGPQGWQHWPGAETSSIASSSATSSASLSVSSCPSCPICPLYPTGASSLRPSLFPTGTASPSKPTSTTIPPDPLSGNTTSWAAAYSHARALVANMTLLEMNNITYGISVGLYDNLRCSGISGSIPRLGFPGLCFQDAGNGVRGQDGVSSFASGVHVGASFNKELTYRRGKYMGAEFRKKGANVALGPVVGPIGRIAEGGRNWEGFGADPYLDGVLGALSIQGLQESVISCVKHYVAYEQETNRSVSLFNASAQAVSANVDDRTLHEVYAWPFHDAVYAGVGSVMTSYNRINKTYASENERTVNEILKEEFGFQGLVVSDWTGQESGLPSANAGLDVAMPNSAYWDNGQLAAAVNNGSFSRERLEDMATRIIATYYQLGQDQAPSATEGLGFGMVGLLGEPHNFINARDPASAGTIYQGAVEGHVLVKNVNNALPLKAPKVLSVFGNDAITPPVYGPDLYVLGTINIDLFNNGWAELGTSLLDAYVLHTYQPLVVNGTLITGGGSGSSTAPYISTPLDALTNRAIADGTQLYSNYYTLEPQVQAASDACLVFINAYSSEGWDRAALTDPNGEQLIKSVASQCSNTIVVIHNAGIRLVDAWIDNPNITAVIFAHLPGQDSGRALTSVLYGDVSPSGRLPYTVAKNESDYGNLLGPCNSGSTNFDPQCDFIEGVNIDYRSFLSRNIAPRYEFGYGLTYSNFTYSNATITVDATKATSSATDLFAVVGTVTAQIRNTGSVAAAEVPQLYVTIPGAETKVLRGFEKLLLQPGETGTANFELRRRDISRWDVVSQGWTQPSGSYSVEVGASVLDVKLTGTFSL